MQDELNTSHSCPLTFAASPSPRAVMAELANVTRFFITILKHDPHALRLGSLFAPSISISCLVRPLDTTRQSWLDSLAFCVRFSPSRLVVLRSIMVLSMKLLQLLPHRLKWRLRCRRTSTLLNQLLLLLRMAPQGSMSWPRSQRPKAALHLHPLPAVLTG